MCPWSCGLERDWTLDFMFLLCRLFWRIPQPSLSRGLWQGRGKVWLQWLLCFCSVSCSSCFSFASGLWVNWLEDADFLYFITWNWESKTLIWVIILCVKYLNSCSIHKQILTCKVSIKTNNTLKNTPDWSKSLCHSIVCYLFVIFQNQSKENEYWSPWEIFSSQFENC